MLYSIILLIGYIALTVGVFVVLRKLTVFALSYFFGSNYTIRYKSLSGSIRTVRVRAEKGLSADAIIAAIDQQYQSKEDSPS